MCLSKLFYVYLFNIMKPYLYIIKYNIKQIALERNAAEQRRLLNLLAIYPKKKLYTQIIMEKSKK